MLNITSLTGPEVTSSHFKFIGWYILKIHVSSRFGEKCVFNCWSGQWSYCVWTHRFILSLLLLEYDQQDILLLQWHPHLVGAVISRRFSNWNARSASSWGWSVVSIDEVEKRVPFFLLVTWLLWTATCRIQRRVVFVGVCSCCKPGRFCTCTH